MMKEMKETTQMTNEEIIALRNECLDEEGFREMSNGWKVMNALAARIYTQELQIRELSENQITDHNKALLMWAKQQLELGRITLKADNNKLIVIEVKKEGRI